MEDILTQRFTYSEITPFNNSSSLKDRRWTPNTFDTKKTDDEDCDIKPVPISEIRLLNDSRIMTLYEKNPKRNTRFFYTNEPINERITLKYSYPDLKFGKIYTTDDNLIKKFYGDPFAGIRTHIIERSIRRHGDKITIKTYVSTRFRKVNCIYFKKTFSVHSVTINLLTGNFYIGIISDKRKEFKCNSFTTLEYITNCYIFNVKPSFGVDNILYSTALSTFNNITFRNVLYDVFGCNDNDNKDKTFTDLLMDVFIKIKKIKAPNDFYCWLRKMYPTEKYLKKNDRKLLLSILDMFDIKSKITNKILHIAKEIDIFALSKLCYIFGDEYSKYIGGIEIKSFDYTDYTYMKLNDNSQRPEKNTFKTIFKNHGFEILDIEKENLVRVINSDPNFKLTIGVTNTLYDHFDMIARIRKYDPDLHMKAKTFREFSVEHLELSKIVSSMKKGWVIEYQFNEKMIEDIEQPLVVTINIGNENEVKLVQELFYPHLLKREEEYMEEGSFMHHCVATYADRETSVIISIRTLNNQDRITCEFDAQTGNYIQAKHFCNGNPPADMIIALNQLIIKTKKYASLGLFGPTEKRKVVVKINGIEIEKEKKEAVLNLALFPNLLDVEF